ncbi:hypothetical protein BU16DRAFT_558974 [Lophium mytilinum]|uniref:F-box domain-containing protein n=1 Tax=Lophium mytilinum TaxID=390894 RepID=A0A6A6R2I9_9PEZI|nr:hypothetical protein BU16DRAFT_558974 [Lophium mytilinum]
MAPHSPSEAASQPETSPLKQPYDTTPLIDLASSRCLTIVELLEQMLLELPIPDIIHYQRVCRFWKDVIAESIPIQRALWMALPVSGVLDVCEAITSFQDWEPTTHDDGIHNDGIIIYDAKLPSVSLKNNPTITDNRGGGFKCGVEMMLRPKGSARRPRYSHRINFFPPHCLQLDQSWTNMFLTDPPVDTVVLLCGAGFDADSHVRVFVSDVAVFVPDENGASRVEYHAVFKSDTSHLLTRKQMILSPGGVKIGHIVRAAFETYPELIDYHQISCLMRFW